MKNHKARKKVFQRCTGGMLACLMLWSVLLEPLSAAGIDFIGTRQVVESYERMNPVSWQQVEPGTPAKELELPNSLRAIVPLKDVDMDFFEQARPQSAITGGSESYDYYYYGYVAPQNKEELYKNGDLAVYTICYAGKGDAAGEVASEAYRVYGSLDGGGNSWYACEKDGTITGEVQDVLMTWDTSDYDGENPGTYEITGEAQGYSVESDDAVVTVDVNEDTDDTDPNDGHTHDEVKDTAEEDSSKSAGDAEETTIPEAEETPGAGEVPGTEETPGTDTTPETEEVPGDEETPGTVEIPEIEDNTPPEEPEGAGETTNAEILLSYEQENPVVQLRAAAGTAAEELNLPETLSAYVIPEEGTEEDAVLQDIPVIWNAEEYDSAAAGIYRILAEPVGYTAECEAAYAEVEVVEEAGEVSIAEFELSNPVVSLRAPEGTAREALALPTELKAVLSLETIADDSAFTQEEPSSEELEKSGYTEPENAEELRQSEEKIIYTFVNTKDETACRVYGSLNGEASAWYACDEEGNITGLIQTVGVTWDTEEYDGNTEGRYVFQGEVSDYPLTAETPCAVVQVYNTDCTCGVDAGSRPWEHFSYCPQFEPVQCMCEGEHDESNRDCPLWNQDVVEIYKPDGVTLVLGRLEDLEIFQEKGFFIPDEPVVHYATSLMSVNGGGANDVAQDDYMRSNAPTSGNSSYTSLEGSFIPGTWIDYLNTIWMNKAFSEFAWATYSQMGKHGTWFGSVASNANADPQTSDYAIPKTVNGICDVYSPEQFRYALLNCAAGVTVRLNKNLNLNGSTYVWTSINKRNKLIIDGNGYTIYNLGMFAGAGVACTFVDAGAESILRNLKFKNAKVVGHVNESNGVSLFGAIETDETLDNLSVSDSLFFGGDSVSAFSSSGAGASMPSSTAKKCFVESSYFYGRRHVASAFALLNGVDASYSYAKDCTVVSIGEHSGGFVSCNDWKSKYTNCFASNIELYSGSSSGVFSGYGNASEYTNCYSSGIVEGYACCGGFIGISQVGHRENAAIAGAGGYAQKFKNCYSTALVGIRTETKKSGGFIGTIIQNANSAYQKHPGVTSFDSCYAAGEVGSCNQDMEGNSQGRNQQLNGGFMSGDEQTLSTTTYKYCYYDKQTTAMREWTTGSKQVTGTVDLTGNNAEPRGVLTSTINKGGAGMASGTYNPAGFYGFSIDNDWQYTAGFYPQLKIFSSATSSDWGSDATAAVVKNASKASVSTVILDTWDTGYVWSYLGVRSATEIPYNEPDYNGYAGGVRTYDTVREIVLDAKVSSGTYWTERISGGAPTDVDGDGKSDGRSIQINNGTAALEVIQPGLNWYRISTSNNTSDTTAGKRPIRLASLMTMDAGEDKTIKSGVYYDHRDDASFTMLDTITENLVVGADDSKIWSTSKTAGYPDNTRYYNVPLNMNGNYAVGKTSQIYTEIWRAKKDGNNNWVADTVDVRVTGFAGSDPTDAQKRWNGQIPMYTDISAGRTYIINYYWRLKDGRYITDSKTITVTPNEYYLRIYAKNNDTNQSSNSSALYLRSAMDNSSTGVVSYSYPTFTSSSTTLMSIPYTRNAAAAWKVKPGYRVVGMKVEMMNKDGTAAGSATVQGDIRDGTKIDIDLQGNRIYLAKDINTGDEHEFGSHGNYKVTYTVKKDEEGGYQLLFNKLKNTPSDELSSATKNGDSTGITTSLYYVNDMMYDVNVTLYVEKARTMTITKKIGGAYGDKEKKFDINVVLRAGSSSGSLYSGDVTCTIGNKVSVLTANSGTVRLQLKHGETATLSGIPSEYSWYKVQETADSSADYTVTYNSSGSVSSGSYVTGIFPAQDAPEITVNNTLKTDRELCIYKWVRDSSGNIVNSADWFDMYVQISEDADFSDQTYTGTYTCYSYRGSQQVGSQNVVFTNGKASVRVPAGGYLRITGLPANYYYKVEELASSQNGYTVTCEKQNGQLSDSTSQVTVTNTMDTRELTIYKEVQGDGADDTKEFLIDVWLGIYPSDKSLAETLITKKWMKDSPDSTEAGTLTFKNGSATVELKSGEFIEISVQKTMVITGCRNKAHRAQDIKFHMKMKWGSWRQMNAIL